MFLRNLLGWTVHQETETSHFEISCWEFLLKRLSVPVGKVPSARVPLDYPEVGSWQSVCPWVAVCFRNLLAWKVRSGEIGERFVFPEIDDRKSFPGHQWSTLRLL